MPRIPFGDLPNDNEVTYAARRKPTRTYVSRSFDTPFGRDKGSPSRYVRRVFDESIAEENDEAEWTEEVVYQTPGGRKQIELHISRVAGAVREIKIQRVPTNAKSKKLETLLTLNRDQSTRLLDMLKAIDSIPIEGGETVHVDDALLRDLFEDPTAIATIYEKSPEQFRTLIEGDSDARDVIALQHRREIARTMRQWLEDPDAFSVALETAGGPEKAWQKILEENPWVLGIGISGQLLTSWHEGKLEQTIVGSSIRGPGKRPDALLRTVGIIRSLVFAEIKHHDTKLLGAEYRSGCWEPSKELGGAIVQLQQTVNLANNDLSDYIHDKDTEGAILDTGTFILRPRSYVIIGSSSQLTGSGGGPIPEMVRSFELFRRSLIEPEIITFDELVARAEWHVEVAEHDTEAAQHSE